MLTPVSVLAATPLPNAPVPVTALPNAPIRSWPSNLPESRQAVTARNAPMQVIHQQGAIWTSPLRIRTHDLIWLAPMAAATGAAIATDHRAMTDVVSQDPTFNQDNVNVSDGLIGGFLGAPVALYGWGLFKHDQHAHETGILGSEAIVDAAVVDEGLKLVFWRERPALDNARGHFFSGNANWDSSFPSMHATLAWSSAAVLAGEYPTWWKQAGIYSAASAVSLTRVLGQKHFPSDVLVGSAVGWLIGHYVYRHYHRWERRHAR
ncbi:MAG: phosphatase PAP2 family protein [Acidobacteriaceae bacterium]